MVKIVKGSKPGSFGKVDWLMSVNWGSLVVALLIALVGWLDSEGIKVLEKHEVLSSSVLAALTLALPMLKNWLSDNSKVTIEEKVPQKDNT